MSRERVLRPLVTAAALALAVTDLRVAAAGEQSAEPVKKNVDVSDTSRRQAFSVVLLLGDMKGGESLEGVPMAARKALSDTKDFLPYKNYRLLDTQWTLCCSGTTSAITRLRGADDQEYELELRANPILAAKGTGFDAGALSIRFFLRELVDTASPKSELDRSRALSAQHPDRVSATKGVATSPATEVRSAQITQELFNLEREHFDLKTEANSLRGRVDVGLADPEKLKRVEGQLQLVAQRITALKTELNSLHLPKTAGVSRVIIDTSFRMDVGETVVVGTSGLKGGSRALIALLTAVSAPPRPR